MYYDLWLHYIEVCITDPQYSSHSLLCIPTKLNRVLLISYRCTNTFYFVDFGQIQRSLHCLTMQKHTKGPRVCGDFCAKQTAYG